MRPTTHRPCLLPNLALGLALALFASCSGGGGGGGGGQGPVEPDLNEGSYSVDDFDYIDEHPTGFHPLGEDGFEVLARNELFTVFPGLDGETRAFGMREDPEGGYAEVGGIDALFAGQDSPHGAAAGQLDDDPHRELVVATLDPGGTRIDLHRVELILPGQYERTFLFSIPAAGWNFDDVRVSLGDVDGDFRDEIVIAARSVDFSFSGSQGRVWVFDDPQDGSGELLDYERNGGHMDIQGLPIDIDGDGTKEIVVALTGDTTDAGRYPIRLYDLADGAVSMTLVHGWRYLYSATDKDYSRAVVGDFDSDGREDLAWVGSQRTNSRTTISIKLFEYGLAAGWESYQDFSIIDVSPAPTFQPRCWAIAAFQPALGRTDLAIAYPANNSEFSYQSMHYEPQMGLRSERAVIPRSAPTQAIALAASDVDADGAEEVQIGLVHYGFGGALALGYAEHDGDTFADLTWQPPTSLGSTPAVTSVPPLPVLACGDYDADGFALKHTGRRFPRLADPIPIVVLAAPPTKSGISQNYDNTASSYSFGMTQGTSIGVSTYTSVTYSGSAGVDLFGILGVEGRASLEKGTERTQTSTSQVTVVEGYTGAYDADVIIFQGTLYEAYEYVIVGASDPAAIGTFLTLDVPHSALTYKWTVDYYNQQVEPEDRIGTDVLTHTPGVIDTYPSQNELADLMAGEMHWDFPDPIPVGQSGGTDMKSVSFASENATEEQLAVSKSYGGGVTFGLPFGASAGAGVDVTNTDGATHGVFYARETSFEATMGDISDPVDYEAWRYNWGFSIHTVGRRVVGENVPDGYTSRKHSFQYLRYWVNPTGTGY